MLKFVYDISPYCDSETSFSSTGIEPNGDSTVLNNSCALFPLLNLSKYYLVGPRRQMPTQTLTIGTRQVYKIYKNNLYYLRKFYGLFWWESFRSESSY